MDRTDGGLVGIRISGKLTTEDVTSLRQYLEEKVLDHGQIRLLFLLDDRHGWKSLSAMWEDLRTELRLNRHVSRIAMVGDRPWEKVLSGVTRVFAGGEVQYFDRRRLEHAWSWLNEDWRPTA